MMGSDLVHRAIIRRPPEDMDDEYEHPADFWDVVEPEAHCYVRIRNTKKLLDGRIVQVEDIVGLFRKDADVQMNDRIVSLVDRRGEVVLEAPLFIDTVTKVTGIGGRTYKRAFLKRSA